MNAYHSYSRYIVIKPRLSSTAAART